MDNKINDENNVAYSKPKMVIQGGHDTTLNVLQFFMLKTFNINLQYVKFGANIYFELHKDKIEDSDNDYNYTVKYFYDSKLMLKIDYDTFKKKVLENVWNEEQIHNFCFQEEKDDNKNKDNSSIIIALIITIIVLFITTIIFALLFLYYRNKALSSCIISNDKLIE